MSKIIGVLLLVGAIGLAAYIGCTPQAGVAKDAIIKKLNSALGELDVARKKIEMRQTELQGKMADLQMNRARAEAKLELLESKKKKSEESIEKIRGQLESVKKMIAELKDSATEKITRGGKEYTKAEIQETAEQAASNFKNEQVKLTSLVTSYDALAGSVKFLKDQESTSRKLMKDLSDKISEIDAKKYAVDAVKENTAIAGDNSSISDSLAAMQKEIEDLGVNVEAALTVETEKMASMNSTSSKVDEILSEPADLNSTEEMLNDLLSK